MSKTDLDLDIDFKKENIKRHHFILGSRVWLLEDPTSGNRNLCDATTAGESRVTQPLDYKKVS